MGKYNVPKEGISITPLRKFNGPYRGPRLGKNKVHTLGKEGEVQHLSGAKSRPQMLELETHKDRRQET